MSALTVAEKNARPDTYRRAALDSMILGKWYSGPECAEFLNPPNPISAPTIMRKIKLTLVERRESYRLNYRKHNGTTYWQLVQRNYPSHN